MGNYRKLGQMLLNKGKLTAEQLDAATRGGHSRGRRIGEALVALGYVTEWDIAECLAEQFDFKVVDPSRLVPSEYALSLLEPEVALSHKVLMLRCSEDAVECVMSDPIDFPTSDMISQMAGKRTCISLAPATALVAAIRKAYGLENSAIQAGLVMPARRVPKPPKPARDREAILARLALHGDVLDQPVRVQLVTGAQIDEAREGAAA